MHPEVEAMEVDEAPEDIRKKKNVTKIRSRNVHGIRNLNATRDHKNTIRQIRTDRKISLVRLFLKLLLIATCAGVLVIYSNNIKELGQHLKSNYYTAYERLSQLSNDLCSKRQANFTPILEAIDSNIIGQRHLHSELDDWFQTVVNAPYSCALFVGATGVGKSFAANIIAKHYPNPMNVLHVPGRELTDAKTRNTAFKMAIFKILQRAVPHGKCTYYMIVVDNLSHNDMPFVRKVSDRLREVSNSHHLMLQALFVFKGTAQHLYKHTVKETIPEARFIKFARLGNSELEYCIRRQASKIGIDLSDRDPIVELVANQINVTRHGCKPVRAKLSLYSI